MSEEGREPEVKPEVEQKPDKIIEIAKAVGWKENGPLDAETFLTTMPGRFQDQTRTMQELKKSVEGITKHFSKTVEAQVRERLTTMEARKEEAIIAGDVAQVKQIDKEIKEIERTEIPQESDVRPEVQAFIEKHEWFDKDRKMTKRAIAFKEEYFDDNPNGTLKDALAYAELELKKAFPDKFEQPAAESRKLAAAAVESPNAQGGKTESWQQMKSKMTSFEKDSMADILTQTHNGKPITTEKAYIESLMAAGAFEGRK